MKSPTVQNKSTLVALQTIDQQSEIDLPIRRLSDITPTSRELSDSESAPTSPKVHELIERSKRH